MRDGCQLKNNGVGAGRGDRLSCWVMPMPRSDSAAASAPRGRKAGRRRSWAAAVIAILLLFGVGLMATASPAASPLPQFSDATPAADPRPEGPSGTAVEKLIELPQAFTGKDNLPDETAFQIAFLAQLERQGLVAPGSVAAAEAAVEQAAQLGGRAPSVIYKDTHLTCDLDGDGVRDVIVNQYDLGTAMPRVYAYSGADGSYLWYHYGSLFYYPWIFGRAGTPEPYVPDNVAPTVDADGDGACDVMLLGFYFNFGQFLFTGTGYVLPMTTQLRMLSGANGYALWSNTYPGLIVVQAEPLTGSVQSITVQGFPTGFLEFRTASGPKFVLKQTDIYFNIVQEPTGLTGLYAFSMWTAEHVFLGDVATGDHYWQRDIPVNPQGRQTNFTWISGVGQLAGDEELEIVLDQHFFYNPQGTQMDDPVTGRALYRFGQGMAVMTLRGELDAGGTTLWRTVLRDEGAARANSQNEESFNTIIWTYGQLLNDFTGDGYADPVGLVLTREYNDAGTVNGAFITFFFPLDGATGERLWSGDLRLQGWGFVSGMNAGAESVPYFAIGTIDLPTDAPPEGRFPPKDIRLMVADVAESSVLWSVEEQFPQDSYLPYSLTLWQYQTQLAPFDLNDDGVKDLLTPSQYIQPTGQTQVLLSTAKHQYEILDGTSGETLSTFQAWGSNGYAVPCGVDGPDDTVTIVSGHGKRMDITRIAASNGTEVWRRPVFNDPAPTSATAGVDLIFVASRCADTGDGSVQFGVNLGLFSFKRGFEIVPVYGYIDTEAADTIWQVPKLEGIPPTFDYLARLLEERMAQDDPEPAGAAVSAALSALPGGLAGLGLAFLRARRGGGAE